MSPRWRVISPAGRPLCTAAHDTPPANNPVMSTAVRSTGRASWEWDRSDGTPITGDGRRGAAPGEGRAAGTDLSYIRSTQSWVSVGRTGDAETSARNSGCGGTAEPSPGRYGSAGDDMACHPQELATCAFTGWACSGARAADVAESTDAAGMTDIPSLHGGLSSISKPVTAVSATRHRARNPRAVRESWSALATAPPYERGSRGRT